MLTDKEIKKQFKEEISLKPDKYYPTNFLKLENFERKQCSKCNIFFWTTEKNRTICGDPNCLGGTQITNNSPAKNKLTYIEVWKKIVEILEPRGYKPINRYPVVARWNPTMEYTIASIAAFQPYVVSGEIDPPEKKLIIPQFCLRFGDVDNVGVTGSHMTCFVMIGQHMFVNDEEWDQEKVFKDIYDFLIYGVGLNKNEITIHEDAWAGGGNFGPCMEFFSRGIELFNQVYMLFEQTNDGRKPLKQKVLDMGLGMERIAWFSQGTQNTYEATFPYVIQNLKKLTKIKMDKKLFTQFSNYSTILNADEVENLEEAWNNIAKKINISSKSLKEKIMPMTALYSIAEHSRTLLVAINDGALPSNVGGGYNLRMLFRRAMRFIDKYNWNIDLIKVCEWHSIELKEIFPELSLNLNNIKKVLDVEKEKYYEMKKRSKVIVLNAIKKGINLGKLIELYDSHGINPDIVKEEALKMDINVNVPDNFYALVSGKNAIQNQITQTKKDEHIDVGTVPDTKILYFDDWKPTRFSATVLKIIDNNVILDRTWFYPTSGGQIHDDGYINGDEVIDVFKQGKIIIHKMKKISFKVGDIIQGIVEEETRKQLTQHHTATHIINSAAKKILGPHINQAGAKKTIEKASIDLTHYQNISEDELKKIEEEANKIINDSIKINKFFMKRDEAEKKYGMQIYQGGAVPGKEIRLVEIEGIDIQACGGTHLNNTNETEQIKILKSSKIQDGIIRLTYTAGKSANKKESDDEQILNEIANFLNVNINQIPSRSKELFDKWKLMKKAIKKDKVLNKKEIELTSKDIIKGNILEETAKILNTQKEHVPSTLNRFMKEYNEMKESIEMKQK
jgi:alanyl-tRNA synthetase